MRRVYREVPGAPERTLYLSFDDGPSPGCTRDVLHVLESHGARATFFVVAARAAAERGLLGEILSAGHAIGNHSFDHRYRYFFSKKERLRDWIAKAEALLTDLTGYPTIGFRSPAGVVTPPLGWALEELGLPLVHWSVRFYDTRFGWSRSRAIGSLRRTRPGSIVLLHDTHSGRRREEFLDSLSAYLEEARKNGFSFAPIPRLPSGPAARRP